MTPRSIRSHRASLAERRSAGDQPGQRGRSPCIPLRLRLEENVASVLSCSDRFPTRHPSIIPPPAAGAKRARRTDRRAATATRVGPPLLLPPDIALRTCGRVNL